MGNAAPKPDDDDSFEVDIEAPAKSCTDICDTDDIIASDEITMAQIMACARGGDIILIQEDVLFDNYTMLNGQVSHYVKQLLRLKVDYQKSTSDYDDPPTVHQWCRCGLICDSEVKDFKYLLEITEDGVQEHELFSRLLMLKNQDKIVGYKSMARAYKLDPD